MKVRPATAADAAACARILNPIITAGGTTAYEDPVDEPYLADWITSAGPGETRLVAEVEGAVVGFQFLDDHPELAPGIADISTFAERGRRRAGVGRALTAATVAAARRAGWAEINATIRADNAGGLAFYSAMGFRDHDVTRAKPLKSGRPVDRISKRLSL